jgi:Uma2 family endonuclease
MPPRLPLLEHGDNLKRDEFHRRYVARPDIGKAELIEGVVHIGSDYAFRSGAPLLENGDHLSREEFRRRYLARPDIKKAELIEGVVYVAAAARFDFHGRQHADLCTWLRMYSLATPGVEAAVDCTVDVGDDSEFQPDGLLRIVREAGGQSHVDGEGWLTGGPELIAEVSASTQSKDLHQKLDVYQRHGVREYLVWRVYDEALDWFVLRDGRYEAPPADAAGVIRSTVFPGLWMDLAPLLRGDFAKVMQVLNTGLASAEHGAFAAELKARMDAARQ